ncbi:MAG: hypothetical protein Q7S31_03230 [bacterium]|nr:hypothetical protein [bacterium]
MLTRPENFELDDVQMRDLQEFFASLSPADLQLALDQTQQDARDNATANANKALVLLTIALENASSTT